jgi:response regulator RpfG family c-di-GMP phosphodiesterase
MTALISRTPCKVLLVDDEENIVRSIARLLLEEETDLEVVSANSGVQGLEALAVHPDVALILSDQCMPGMSGAEFLQKARLIAPDAVRMVLTGYADMAATMDAINKGGASRYLTKPWDDDVLRRTIHEGVEQYRMVQENRTLTALVEKQNRELSEWNDGLKGRVLEQTATIRRQNEELRGRNRQIGEAFSHTILAFSRLIELHSTKLQDHTRNVTALSVNCAGSLGLDARQIETIRTAALLHDIGVIGIPPAVVEKRVVGMTQEELDLYQLHSVRGQAAVDVVEELREAGLLIRHHHERYDGQGFPDRLAGDAIPVGARIIGFADFIDHELGEAREEAAVRAVLTLASKQLGIVLDPAFFDPMQRHAVELYASTGTAHEECPERELRPKELHEGLVINRNLYSGTGLLLLTKGTLLDSQKIAAILRYYDIDSPASGVFVTKGAQP